MILGSLNPLACDLDGCGEIVCDRCDEAMSCMGPEPRACGVTCTDCRCDCTACLHTRDDMRAELLRQIEGEGA